MADNEDPLREVPIVPGNNFCATEGSGILEHYREETEKSNQDKAKREAIDMLRALREEFNTNKPEDQWWPIERVKRVIDELFNAMGW